jgi:hypothetical protein
MASNRDAISSARNAGKLADIKKAAIVTTRTFFMLSPFLH